VGTRGRRVSPELKGLLADVKLAGGKLAMPTERFTAWRQRLKQTAPDARERCAVELVTLANRFARRAGEAGHDAFGQLMVLATDLLAAPALRGWSARKR
jgi:hypothetical protein